MGSQWSFVRRTEATSWLLFPNFPIKKGMMKYWRQFKEERTPKLLTNRCIAIQSDKNYSFSKPASMSLSGKSQLRTGYSSQRAIANYFIKLYDLVISFGKNFRQGKPWWTSGIQPKQYEHYLKVWICSILRYH